jgi:hypothetical protein
MILRGKFLAVVAQKRQARARREHCSHNHNPGNQVQPAGIPVHYVH